MLLLRFLQLHGTPKRPVQDSISANKLFAGTDGESEHPINSGIDDGSQSAVVYAVATRDEMVGSGVDAGGVIRAISASFRANSASVF